MQEFLRRLFDPHGRTALGGAQAAPQPSDGIPLVDVPRETELKELKPRASKGRGSAGRPKASQAGSSASEQAAPPVAQPGPVTSCAEFCVELLLWSLHDPEVEALVAQWGRAARTRQLQLLCSTGVTLCRFINELSPGTIDERAIHAIGTDACTLVDEFNTPGQARHVSPPRTASNHHHPTSASSHGSPDTHTPGVSIKSAHQAWPAGDTAGLTPVGSPGEDISTGKVIQSINAITVDPEWFSATRTVHQAEADAPSINGAVVTGQESQLNPAVPELKHVVQQQQLGALPATAVPAAPQAAHHVPGIAVQQRQAPTKTSRAVPQAVRWNWQLAYSSALSLGCCLAGVSVDNLMKGQVTSLIRFIMELLANHLLTALMETPAILSMQSFTDAWLAFSSPQELINRWVRQRLDSDTLLGQTTSLPQNWPLLDSPEGELGQAPGSLGGIRADLQLIRQLLEKELLCTSEPHEKKYIDGSGLADMEVVLGLRPCPTEPVQCAAPPQDPNQQSPNHQQQLTDQVDATPQEPQQQPALNGIQDAPTQQTHTQLDTTPIPAALDTPASDQGCQQPQPAVIQLQEPLGVPQAVHEELASAALAEPVPESVQEELEHVHAEVTLNLARKLGVDMPMQASWLKTGGEPFIALFLLVCLHKHLTSQSQEPVGDQQSSLSDTPLHSRPVSEEGHVLEQRKTGDSASSGQDLTPTLRRALEASDSIRRRTGAGGQHRERPKDVYSVDAQEERLLRAWLNSLLAEKGIRVTSLFDASMCTGWPLLVACDLISPGCIRWHRTFEPPFSSKHRRVPPKLMAVENGNQVCHVATKVWHLPLVNIGGIDIAEGHKMALMSLVWQMMRHHMVVMLGSSLGFGATSGKPPSPPGSITSFPNSPMAAGSNRQFGADQPLGPTPFAAVQDAKTTPAGSSRRSSVTGSDTAEGAETARVPAWPKDVGAGVTGSGAGRADKPATQAALEEDVLYWVNRRLQLAARQQQEQQQAGGEVVAAVQVSGLSDPVWASGKVLLQLMSVTWPGVIAEQHISDENNAASYEMNARYALSVARSLGCHVYSCTWEDVVQVRPRPLLTLLAALMAQDLQQRAAAAVL